MRLIYRLLRNPLRRRHSDGSVAIEFALIAPVLLLLITAIVEFGLILAVMVVLEGATNIGARIGKTGFTTGGLTREQLIRQEVVRLSGGFINPGRLIIDVLSYNNFDNVGRPEPCITPAPCSGAPGVNFVDVNGNGTWDADSGSAGAGGGGAIVLYRVRYPWSIVTPKLSSLLGGMGGTYMITSVATVRNEAF